ncbi:MAG: sigma-70 family RNA polymerase sigma factor [Bacteroidetes bacterium]|nr:sigma-70 family RNA polymerase sigma factor [Bacteroidota bacterium]
MKKLIDGCKAGNSKARKELYHRYNRKFLGTCLRYARDKAEAEDMMLEGFMQIFSKIETYSHAGSFEGWMKKVMVYTAIDFYRKNKKELHHDNIDDHLEVGSDDTNALNQLSAKEIIDLIQTLPQGYRIVFNLFAIEGYSHQEIAERLDITESTSKSQVRKARIWLMKKLRNNYE